MAEPTPLPQPVDAIDPEALKVVRHVMEERGIDPALYEAEYFADQDFWTVALYYRHKKPGLRGSDPEHPDYEIVISRDSNQLESVSIAR
jgi:hypothetical protein